MTAFKLTSIEPEKVPAWKRFIRRGAVFSPCGEYRHSLTRVWDESKPIVQLVLLNPSVADEEEPDATVKSAACILDFNGMGGMVITNLFDYVTPYPRVLAEKHFPFSQDCSVVDYARSCAHTVIGWGALHDTSWDRHARVIAEKRASTIFSILNAECKSAIRCFGRTKSGNPAHPLYLKHTTVLKIF